MENNIKKRVLFEDTLLAEFDDMLLDRLYFVFDDIIEKVTSFREEKIWAFASNLTPKDYEKEIKLFLIGKDSKRQADMSIKQNGSDYMQSKAIITVDEFDKAEIFEFEIEVDDYHTYINPISIYNKDTGNSYSYKNNNQ